MQLEQLLLLLGRGQEQLGIVGSVLEGQPVAVVVVQVLERAGSVAVVTVLDGQREAVLLESGRRRRVVQHHHGRQVVGRRPSAGLAQLAGAGRRRRRRWQVVVLLLAVLEEVEIVGRVALVG